MNSTQQRIYNYLTGIIKTNNIPVMITYHNIASKLNLSEITIKRNLDDMITNHILYSSKIGSNILYNTKPIDVTKDFVCYVRNMI